MAGTTVATINLLYWLIDIVLDSILFFYEIRFGDKNHHDDWFWRIITVLVSIFSNIFIWRQAKKEFSELKVILKRVCSCRHKQDDQES